MIKENPISLRPHHGMCLAYFEGKGYSEGFIAHMQRMLELFTAADVAAADPEQGGKKSEKVLVRLTARTDEICSACPNNLDGNCREAEKVRRYDLGVLDFCGLKEGQILEYDQFASLVQERILSAGKRVEICGGCQWESICAKRKNK